ncbi:MAG: type III pantothenate kinase [Candidatus Omnitrophica bacterium]|nr:type III pantothenate kinase [Candidatus Omnitrophota bacterium]
MFLAVDIGNTSINNGIFDGKNLKRTFRIPTYAKGLEALYGKKLNAVNAAVIVSVVPEILKKTEKIFLKILDKVLVVGRDADVGVKNLYKSPKQVGQDRLVNARAAYELYGGDCLIVDFGTATTIDIVNSKRQYLGGVIAPGVELSLDALSEKTALLPKVRLRKPKSILGKETRESMINGAVYGFSGLCDGVVARLRKERGIKGRVVATGGLSKLIGPYCETVDIIDPELTLKGLRLIGAENNV